jgi:tetratricopeptide (TPR) repeat protein
MASIRNIAILGTLAVCSIIVGCTYNPVRKLISDTRGRSAPAKRSPDETGDDSNLIGAGTQEPFADPVDPVRQKNNLLFARGRLLEADQKPEEASKVYEQILETDARHAAALHRLAVLAVQYGKPKTAEERFRDALAAADHASLQTDKQVAQLHSDYGYFCYLQDRRADAEKHLNRALHRDGSLLGAHNNLGILKARKGDLESAKYHFERARRTPAESFSNIAYARMMERDFEGAQAAYRSALAADPKHARSQKGLEAAVRLAELSDSKNGVAPKQDAVATVGHTVSELEPEEPE